MSQLLAIGLSAAIPLRIAELKAKGGPDDDDYERARQYSRTLAERGDVLMFRGGKPGEAAELFNRLAEAVAVMAFAPGGITLFGDHWEAKVDDA